MPTLFQPSSTSFGEAKTLVAEQHSRQSGPGMLLRAGNSLRAAVARWNRFNWEWNIVTAADINVTAGVQEYDLPYDFRDLYCAAITVNGATRALAADGARNALRSNPSNQSGETTGYTLVKRGSTGKLRLLVPPNTDGVISQIMYYRRMVQPCAVSASGSWATGSTSITANGSLAGVTLGSLWAPPSVTAASQYRTVTDITLIPSGIVVVDAAPAASASGTFTIGGDAHPLDIPEDFTWSLLAAAIEHFLVGINGPEKLISYWRVAAAEGLAETKGALRKQADRDVRFIPAGWGSYNPNQVVY